MVTSHGQTDKEIIPSEPEIVEPEVIPEPWKPDVLIGMEIVKKPEPKPLLEE